MIIIYLMLIIPICFFLTKEIKNIITSLLIIQRNTYLLNRSNSLSNIHQEKILSLAQAYISRKQWLNCIIILEEYLNESISNIDLIEIYKCIGFCYFSKEFYPLAEDYYKKGLEKFPSNIECLQNLRHIYSKNKLNDPIKLKNADCRLNLLQTNILRSG
uniref:Ycf37 n=1 Tax=Gelidium elegans TaxID=37200 RepID=A0A141SDK3_GELEL|nr:hypothetical protein Gele_120 [Gelidium elegans]AMK96371.1 hypothetical protein Gele_120 [Gelidium elegans]